MRHHQGASIGRIADENVEVLERFANTAADDVEDRWISLRDAQGNVIVSLGHKPRENVSEALTQALDRLQGGRYAGSVRRIEAGAWRVTIMRRGVMPDSAALRAVPSRRPKTITIIRREDGVFDLEGGDTK